MLIRINAFTQSHSNTIPKKYTCDGEGISPEISWDEVPEKTESFALIMEGLDVPNRSNPLVLWVIYNIPGPLRAIASNSTPSEAKVGINDLGKKRYSAPCPKPGTHKQRYQVTLYSLDKTFVFLPDETTKEELVKAMKHHILAVTENIGFCERHG